MIDARAQFIYDQMTWVCQFLGLPHVVRRPQGILGVLLLLLLLLLVVVVGDRNRKTQPIVELEQNFKIPMNPCIRDNSRIMWSRPLTNLRHRDQDLLVGEPHEHQLSHTVKLEQKFKVYLNPCIKGSSVAMLVLIPDLPRAPGSGPTGWGTSWTPTKPYSGARQKIQNGPESMHQGE